jgi:hypothetical protein
MIHILMTTGRLCRNLIFLYEHVNLMMMLTRCLSHINLRGLDLLLYPSWRAYLICGPRVR